MVLLFRRSALLLTLAAFGFIVPLAAATEWPTYLNGNDRIGVTGQSLPENLELHWTHKSAVPIKLAWEGPRESPIEGHVMKHRVAYDAAIQVAIGAGRVFFGSPVDHHLYCVDEATGKELWSVATEGPIRLAPTLWDNKIYFGSDDGWVRCLNAADGAVVWKYRPSQRDERLLARGAMISRWPVRTGVLIDEGIAYFGAGIFPHENVYLCALDAKSGNVIWKNDHISQQDAGRNDLSPQGYLLANKDSLFVPSGRNLPRAFSKNTGEQVFKRTYSWRSSAGGVVGGTRAVLSDGQLYASGAHHFLALDSKTGAAGYAYIPGRQLTFHKERAYIASDKAIMAVNRREHEAASVKRQALYVKRRGLRRNPEKLAALDKEMAKLAATGVLWKADFTAADGALVVAGNVVIAGGEGIVCTFDINSGELIWSAEVDGQVAGLAVGDSLMVSTTTGYVYSFGALNDQPKTRATPTSTATKKSPLHEAAVAEIIKNTNITSGFCLVLGSADGQLAHELVKQTDLKVIGIESDEKRLAGARERMRRLGLYGHRVVFLHGEPAKTPLSNYFANLVVSDSMLTTGNMPATAVELGRYVKPCGGVVCFGKPQTSDVKVQSELQEQLVSMYLRDDATVKRIDDWVVLTRGKLAGASDWSHQYGNTANTCSTDDYRVKGSLGVLWYGDPGPQKTINRHEAASAPLSTNGRFFVQGTDSLRGYDAYNGQFLWELKNPGAIRTGVFNNYETSNLAASDDHVYMVVEDACTVLDAATGKKVNVFRAPQAGDGVPRSWGFIAHEDGIVYGTATIRTELASQLRRRGRTIGAETDGVFAVDAATGKQLWQYNAKNIMHVTIAIADDRIYFIESTISPAERDALLRQDKTGLKNLTPEQVKAKEAELKKLDLRTVVALNAKTGEEVWRKPVDVTFCSGVSAGGGNLALMVSQGKIVVCGANANGHYWRQFLSGEFKKRRLVVMDAADGKKLWAKDADYMNRPAIIDGYIYAEPWAFDLNSGEAKTRVHPVTQERTEWRFSRPGHHCGVITATPNMMFFRSGFIGYYDLYEDSGTKHFAGQRLGCWVNAIPGNGLVMIPEASAGCVCLFSITSTVVMEPRQDRDAAWGIYSAVGSQTPVKRLAINLGAPGDRRSGDGKLWLAYPRPKAVGRLEYVFNIKPALADSGRWYDNLAGEWNIKNADPNWVYVSGARGLQRCTIPLRAKNDGVGNYTVKLHFAELEDSVSATFDIALQGNVVAHDVNVVKEAGGRKAAIVKTFSAVSVPRDLEIQLRPHDQTQLPAISAIEIEVEE